jgi:hypothetical protein
MLSFSYNNILEQPPYESELIRREDKTFITISAIFWILNHFFFLQRWQNWVN